MFNTTEWLKRLAAGLFRPERQSVQFATRRSVRLELVLLEARWVPAGLTGWTGGAMDHNWETVGNWSNGVPQNDSDVEIVIEDEDITVPENVTVKSLTYANLDGSLGGDGHITITDRFIWTAGELWGPGTLTLEGESSIEVDGTADSLGRSIINTGTLTWTSGGISLSNGTVFTNAEDGVFDIQTDSSIVGGLFVNDGVFKKSLTDTQGGITTITSLFDNTGSGPTGYGINFGVTVLVGIVDFTNDGSHTGFFGANANATLKFTSGTQTCSTGTTFGSVSEIRFEGGVLAIPRGQSVSNTGAFALTGATIEQTGVAAGVGTFNNSGNFLWSSGDITDIRFNNYATSGSAFVVDSIGTVLWDSVYFANYGQATWTAGDITFKDTNAAAIVQNLGSFDIDCGGTANYTNVGNHGALILNDRTVATAGVINKNAGGANTINPIISNAGIINLNGLSITTAGGFNPLPGGVVNP